MRQVNLLIEVYMILILLCRSYNVIQLKLELVFMLCFRAGSEMLKWPHICVSAWTVKNSPDPHQSQEITVLTSGHDFFDRFESFGRRIRPNWIHASLRRLMLMITWQGTRLQFIEYVCPDYNVMLQVVQKHTTRWASTRYKWSCNLYNGLING